MPKRDTLEVKLPVLPNFRRFAKVVLAVAGCFSPSVHRRLMDGMTRRISCTKSVTHVSIVKVRQERPHLLQQLHSSTLVIYHCFLRFAFPICCIWGEQNDPVAKKYLTEKFCWGCCNFSVGDTSWQPDYFARPKYDSWVYFFFLFRPKEHSRLVAVFFLPFPGAGISGYQYLAHRIILWVP